MLIDSFEDDHDDPTRILVCLVADQLNLKGIDQPFEDDHNDTTRG